MAEQKSLISSPLSALFAVFFSVLILSGIVHAQDPDERVSLEESTLQEPVDSENNPFRLMQIAGGLEHPWAIGWLPDGRILVTERPGNLLLIDNETVVALEGLPEIDTDEDQLTAPEGGNQGGLLDIAVHPEYEENGWIYFTYSSPGDDDGVAGEDRGTGTALARARLNDDETALVDVETIYAQTPRTEPGRHYGSRIIFPGDGTVIFSIGDRGIRWPSQDLTDPAGSMIRLNEDGGAYEDNPFVGMEPGNLRPEIFSFGHRNNQGLIIHPETNEIWAIDHGPYGGDLLYVVEAGNNYGWPQVTFGEEYSTGEKIGIGQEAPGVTGPVHVWDEAIAPSGMTYFDGESFPEWDGNIFVGSLLQEQLHRLEIDGQSVTHEEVLLQGTVGRIRDVRQGPDGNLYLITDEDDAGIYRMEPVTDVAEAEGE